MTTIETQVTQSINNRQRKVVLNLDDSQIFENQLPRDFQVPDQPHLVHCTIFHLISFNSVQTIAADGIMMGGMVDNHSDSVDQC